MNGLASPVIILWTLSVLSQLVVCVFLFRRGYSRRLPIFTSYVLLNLFQAVFLLIIYQRLGFNSHSVLILSWITIAITVFARILAGIELIHSVLREYTGIWNLFSRLLVMASAIVLTYAAVDASRDMKWVLTVTDRGFHIAFAIAVVLCLGTVRYYPIHLHPVYKTLLLGFAGYSCAGAVANTLLEHFLFPQYRSHEAIWQAMTLATYILVLIFWATALRKPMAATERPVLLPASVYQKMSPAINHALRRLNEQLSEFLPSSTSENGGSITEEP
jgi:hypothetical protein